MKSSFTVDLEDWFCSHNLARSVTYEEWDVQESRVERNTYRLLDLLSEYHTRGTFFVLGWIADRYPGLVKDIALAGHEIASHGYSHTQLQLLTAPEFEEDLANASRAIYESCSVKPLGYRAPAFSMVQETLWALPILKANGILYDSSVYPVSIHPDYGIKSCPVNLYQPIEGLTEVPLSCISLPGFRLPFCGGAYFRFLPYRIFRSWAKTVIKNKRPFIFYIHPWEIDDAFPKIQMPYSKKLRHYHNLDTTFSKLRMLLNEFEFTTMQNII